MNLFDKEKDGGYLISGQFCHLKKPAYLLDMIRRNFLHNCINLVS